MKGGGGAEVLFHSFLTLAVDGGDCPTSFPGRFNPGKEPSYRLNRKLRGPQSRSGRFGQQKSLAPKIG